MSKMIDDIDQKQTLKSIVYDDDSGSFCVTIRSVDVWFKSAANRGDKLVLYSDRLKNTRTAVVSNHPVSAETLMEVARIVRKHGPGHIDNYEPFTNDN